MYNLALLSVLLSCAFLLTARVSAIPSWQGATSPDHIGTLVPGAGAIELLGPPRDSKDPVYMSSTAPQGVPAILTGYSNPNPPVFYIDRGNLYQLINSTSILAVDVVDKTANATITSPPLQMVLSNKRTSLKTGRWSWRGTGLMFQYDGKNNQGLFFHCKTSDGHGLYVVMHPGKPDGCEFVTLHSFTRQKGKMDPR